MESQLAQTDVVIVGGGLSGLSAACYLARGGVSVTLFEKSSNLGGRATTQTYENHHFNRGIHALYTGGAAEYVLKELAIPYSGHSPKGIYALRQGKLYTAPIDSRTLLGTNLLSLADKLELMRVFMSFPRLNAREMARMSVQEWLDRAVQRPAVRELLAANARTFVYSSALDLVSAEVFIKKTQLSLKHPVLYIDGGWQTIVRGLRRAAEAAGAHITSDARVEAIDYRDSHVEGVRLRYGSRVRASAVIIATNPHDAVKLVDEGRCPALRQIVGSLIPAQVACLDVALSRLPDPHHPVVQDLEQPRFMSAQSLFSEVAPAGGALIYTFKQLDPRHPSDPYEDERDLENLLDIAQPGWREALVKRYYLPRIDAIGMLPTANAAGYAGRPRPEVPGITNLYVIGDWIGEGFLSDASMGSHVSLPNNY